MYSGSIDHPLYHLRIELKKCATYGIRTRAVVYNQRILSPPDLLGQSGALGAGIEPAASRLTVGRSVQLS